MATQKRTPHPARTLLIFFLVTAAMYGLMAITSTWSPRLGLDLRGGTSITLTANATNGKSVTPTSLEQARNIIQQRVNSLGVGESSVKTMGSRNIVVSAPNVDSRKLVEMVGQTAQLGFRMVYTYAQATPTASASASPSTAAPSTLPQAPATTGTTASALPQAPVSASASSGSASAGSTTSASASASSTAKNATSNRVTTAENWTPSAADQAAFAKYTCADKVADDLDKPLVTCDREKKVKYLLSPVALPGTLVTQADATMPQNSVSYVVELTFNSQGATDFGAATTYLCSQTSPRNQFAIVLDGKVISAPRLDGTTGARCPINTGQAQISGNFTQQSANDLANVLKYGALPLSFDVSSVDAVSPTLGGEQLRAGLIAGVIGLILVAGYCLLYYRGLGLVVISSLAIAGLFTYASMVLLGSAVGFTLSLAGIAGAIVAIGITADSFIVYFERIRDEIREGRTLRTALETGWRKARGTVMMADGVSLLSAVVLFILSVDQVKGFAFTLGLTTVIDLLICFFFTHPIVILLGRSTFWGQGRRGSGLEASHMGVTQESLLGRRSRTGRAARTTSRTQSDSKEA